MYNRQLSEMRNQLSDVSRRFNYYSQLYIDPLLLMAEEINYIKIMIKFVVWLVVFFFLHPLIILSIIQKECLLISTGRRHKQQQKKNVPKNFQLFQSLPNQPWNVAV